MWFSALFAEPTRQKAITWDVWAIFVPAKRVDSASYSRGPGKAGQLALQSGNVKIIDNYYFIIILNYISTRYNFTYTKINYVQDIKRKKGDLPTGRAHTSRNKK